MRKGHGGTANRAVQRDRVADMEWQAYAQVMATTSIKRHSRFVSDEESAEIVFLPRGLRKGNDTASFCRRVPGGSRPGCP